MSRPLRASTVAAEAGDRDAEHRRHAGHGARLEPAAGVVAVFAMRVQFDALTVAGEE